MDSEELSLKLSLLLLLYKVSNDPSAELGIANLW